MRDKLSFHMDPDRPYNPFDGKGMSPEDGSGAFGPPDSGSLWQSLPIDGEGEFMDVDALLNARRPRKQGGRFLSIGLHFFERIKDEN